MENDKIKSDKLISLTKEFIIAIESEDLETIDRILSNTLRYKQKISGSKYEELIKKQDIQKLKRFFPLIFLENPPHIYKKKQEAKVVYEINTDWHLLETNFQSGFCRHTFSFRKKENWKLVEIKKEFIRFSKYNLKKRLNRLKNGLNK